MSTINHEKSQSRWASNAMSLCELMAKNGWEKDLEQNDQGYDADSENANKKMESKQLLTPSFIQ